MAALGSVVFAQGASAASDQAAIQSASDLVAAQPAKLHVSRHDQFDRHAVIEGSKGLKYVPYDRTYKGLPVKGGDFVVTTDASGDVVSTSVAQKETIDVSTTPTLTAEQAAAIAKGQLAKVDSVEGTHLIVDALQSTPTLAYESIVNGSKGKLPSHLHVIVDAATGKVLSTRDEVVEGTGTAAWNGPNPLALATTQSGSTFSLKDPTQTNLACQDAANNTTFSKSTDSWGNGDATARETGCVDALFGAEQEARMLAQWFGRNGMNGAGGWVPIRVGLNDLNAFYDGTQVQVGHNSANQWIGSIDVVAHEFGHGIDDHTPGGISGGGTQEAIADAFGAMTEWYSNEPAPFDTPDFLVGEKINLVGSGPIRNMSNPSALGDPNCYSASIPSTEVHSAAGPFNHWFYLLAQGSNPTNGQPASPTCNGSTITGLGVQKAGAILYNAMLQKTSASSYLRYRTWTLQAAKNLYPGSCTEFNTVKAAWDAISVPAQAADPTCSVSGSPVVTNPGTATGTVGTATSLQMAVSGGTSPYTWSATGLPAGLSINSSTGLISGTPTTAGTSTVTVNVSGGGTGSTQFTWTINPAGGGCASPGQKLGNPGFESGNAPWTATAGVLGNVAGQTAHAGTKYAWLDGYGVTHTDTLSQSVTIPAGCTNYTLSYWLHIDSAETTTTTQFDRLTVKLGSTTLATYSNLNKAAGYQLRSFNVGGFAGQTVTLTFTGTEDVSLQTSFVLDDLALNVS